MPLKVNGKSVSDGSASSSSSSTPPAGETIELSDLIAETEPALVSLGITSPAQLKTAESLLKNLLVTDKSFASASELAKYLFSILHSQEPLLHQQSEDITYKLILESIENESCLSSFKTGGQKTVSIILPHPRYLLSQAKDSSKDKVLIQQVSDMQALNKLGINALKTSGIFTFMDKKSFISEKVEGAENARILDNVVVGNKSLTLSRSTLITALRKAKIFDNLPKLKQAISDLAKIAKHCENHPRFLNDLQCLVQASTGNLIIHDPSATLPDQPQNPVQEKVQATRLEGYEKKLTFLLSTLKSHCKALGGESQ